MIGEAHLCEALERSPSCTSSSFFVALLFCSLEEAVMWARRLKIAFFLFFG
jgi:hypothetical protein